MAEIAPPGPNATIDHKLDYLIQLSVNTAKEVTSLKQSVDALQVRVSAAETDIGSSQAEIKLLKNSVNRLEQANRNLTIRIMGVLPADGEYAAKVAYDRVLKPILAKAKDCNKINTIPQLATVISEAYRARPRSADNAMSTDRPAYPPHIIVKLTSSLYKTVLFSTKKDGLPLPSEAERAAGIRRLGMVEELTPLTFKYLKSLRECSQVNRAWTINGQILYTLNNDPQNTVRRVSSLFEHPNLTV